MVRLFDIKMLKFNYILKSHCFHLKQDFRPVLRGAVFATSVAMRSGESRFYPHEKKNVFWANVFKMDLVFKWIGHNLKDKRWHEKTIRQHIFTDL